MVGGKVPTTLAQLDHASLAKFVAWLCANGAERLPVTNEWEVLRYRAGRETCVVYRNSRGRLTWPNSTAMAWHAYKSGQSWRAIPRGKRPKKKAALFDAVRRRDGDLCFFCYCSVGEADETLEHLVPITHGGPSHLSNLFLAHQECNAKAGHLSAPEKIRIHVDAVLRRHANA